MRELRLRDRILNQKWLTELSKIGFNHKRDKRFWDVLG